MSVIQDAAGATLVKVEMFGRENFDKSPKIC